MILCDIGNTRMHFYDGQRLMNLSYDEGILQFKDEPVYFICVNEEIKRSIEKEAFKWIDLSDSRILKSDYRGLGIDREAVCLGMYDGVVIDAGSAITVDIMQKGRHLGGWIWPGVKSLKDAYRRISSRLDVPIVPDTDLNKIPLDTSGAINFAVFAPIKMVIETFAPDKRITVTGGDADLFAPLFPEAVIDRLLVFKGMEKMIKEKRC